MQLIETLPPNIPPDRLVELVNDRITQINAALRGVLANPAEAAADLGTFRIVNLADPKNDLDGVNLRTLKRWQPVQQQETPVANRGLDHYAIVWSKDGTLNATSETAPCYIVDEGREGVPRRAWFKCKGAPSSDATFNMQIDGVTLLSANATIPAGSTDTVFAQNLAIHPTMKRGAQVDLVIAAGGLATLFSAGLIVERK